MKIEINYMNSKLIVEIKNNETPITVKDLLQEIKLFLKTMKIILIYLMKNNIN